MAGGKLTPRQKMINLMYLVFIAMLALNMSKEVLSAFGLMNEKFEAANTNSLDNNARIKSSLDLKASSDPTNFLKPKQMADKVATLSKDFFAYIGELKVIASKGSVADAATGKLPYEQMDKGENLDNAFFTGDAYSTKGKEVITTIDKYKADIKAVLGNDVKYQSVIKAIDTRFSTADVKDREGITKKFLDYHYKGFPAIASIAKLTAMQNDVKSTEENLLNAFIGNKTVEMASFKNYTAIVIPEKSAFFAGEAVKGRIVLGRFDKSTVPTSVVVNGSTINLATSLVDGQVNFSFGAGSVGEHDITGKFNFMEDGKPVPIDIKGNYVVVPKPNSATISADKMNVVYRGVPNPMTISFAGISSDKVNASAPGMSRGAKAGQYTLRPGSGASLMIVVSGTLPDGSKVSDKKEFRIKGLPAPTGKIRGEVAAKGSKSNLAACTVSAVMEDFDFPVTVNVTQFNIKVPGQPTMVINGSRMDSRAKGAIERATRGDVVVISEIKANFSGIDQVAKRVSTCTYEVQ
jgi:gliding motility-associated protein GldM